MKNKKAEKNNALPFIKIAIALLLGALAYWYYQSFTVGVSVLIGVLILTYLYSYFNKKLKEMERIKKMEDVFPDFIELMASNLRAGMTMDQALLSSSRKEFAPLDEEILQLGKDIVTGKDISAALQEMSGRIRSEKISKTIDLINSGIRSGGNLSILLEDTAITMRERDFVEKKASSNVLMYVIFIFFASAIGAPLLFALSSVLVEVMAKILSTVPSGSENMMKVPFALTKISISSDFVLYFSMTFLILTNLLSSLMLGVTNKGEEKDGLKYLIPMVLLSVTVFFVIKEVMFSYFSGLLG
jgi:flagellar protein FlaJ